MQDSNALRSTFQSFLKLPICTSDACTKLHYSYATSQRVLAELIDFDIIHITGQVSDKLLEAKRHIRHQHPVVRMDSLEPKGNTNSINHTQRAICCSEYSLLNEEIIVRKYCQQDKCLDFNFDYKGITFFDINSLQYIARNFR